MQYESILEYWHPENLKRWRQEVLQDLVLPEASKLFLKEIGLPAPSRWIGPWQLDWDDNLSPHPTKATILLCRNHGHPSIWVEQAGGVLWDRPNSDGEWLINSSVERFGLSLTEYDKFREKAVPYRDLALPQRLLRFQNNLKKIDPEVMADERSYWPSDVSEMRQMSSS